MFSSLGLQDAADGKPTATTAHMRFGHKETLMPLVAPWVLGLLGSSRLLGILGSLESSRLVGYIIVIRAIGVRLGLHSWLNMSLQVSALFS